MPLPAEGGLCFCDIPADSWRLARVLGAARGRAGQPSVAVQVLPVDGEAVAQSSPVEVPVGGVVEVDEPLLLAARSAEDDLFKLQELQPWTILHQIRQRYWAGRYFTDIGPILICVNPYDSRIPLYSDAVRLGYLQGGGTKPHLWAVAHRVYRQVLRAGSQCVLVSGESGSGKTFSIRMITEFLADVSTQHAPGEEQAEARRVAHTQPKVGLLLEAFGNAKTRRNHDSSRFVKFARLQFNTKGYLSGCQVECHLLEVSRVVFHAAGERSFHIFYQVYAAWADRYRLARCRPWLFQGIPEDQWVNQPGGRAMALAQHGEVQDSLQQLGFDAAAQAELYNVVAGLMHLLCVNFTADSADSQPRPTEPQWLQYVAELWAVDAARLQHALTSHTRQAGKSSTVSPITATEARAKAAALAQRVYGWVFEWLATRLNARCAGAPEGPWIGMLDIFGFEAFPRNSFEQFCINFANEKLQQYYSQTTASLLDKYAREGVTPPEGLDSVADNGPCVQVLERLIGTLDDLCSNPKAHPTDADFLQAVLALLKAPACPKNVIGQPSAKDARDQFSIRHYADNSPVWYTVAEFLVKNSSKVSRDVLDVVGQSPGAILQGLASPTDPATRSAQEKPLAGSFRRDMTRLLLQMSEEAGPENLHWVRCIKPTHQEKPKVFDGQLVMKQVECVLPLLEVARVSQDVWYDHRRFLDTFLVLIPRRQRGPDDAGNLRRLAASVSSPPTPKQPPGRRPSAVEDVWKVQVGRSQVCLSRAAHAWLELRRNGRLFAWQWFAAMRLLGKGRRLVMRTRGWALAKQLEDTEAAQRQHIQGMEHQAAKGLAEAAQQAAEEARLEGRIAEAVEAARREAERELRAAREADHLAVEAERARALEEVEQAATQWAQEALEEAEQRIRTLRAEVIAEVQAEREREKNNFDQERRELQRLVQEKEAEKHRLKLEVFQQVEEERRQAKDEMAVLTKAVAHEEQRSRQLAAQLEEAKGALVEQRQRREKVEEDWQEEKAMLQSQLAALHKQVEGLRQQTSDLEQARSQAKREADGTEQRLRQELAEARRRAEAEVQAAQEDAAAARARQRDAEAQRQRDHAERPVRLARELEALEQQLRAELEARLEDARLEMAAVRRRELREEAERLAEDARCEAEDKWRMEVSRLQRQLEEQSQQAAEAARRQCEARQLSDAARQERELDRLRWQFEQEKSQLRWQCERETDRLRQELDRQKAALELQSRQQVQAAEAQAKELLWEQREALQQQCELQVGQLRKELELQLHTAQAEAEEAARRRCAKVQHEADIRVQTLELELRAARDQGRRGGGGDATDSLQQMKAEHRQEMEALRAEFASLTETARHRFEWELRQAHLQYAAERDAEVDRFRRQVEAEREQWRTTAERRQQHAAEEVRRALEGERVAERERHTLQLQQLRLQYEAQLTELRGKMTSIREEDLHQQQRQLAAANEALQRRFDAEREEWTRTVAAEHARDVAAREVRHRQEVAQLQAELDRVRASFVAQVDSVRREEADRAQRSLATMKAQQAELHRVELRRLQRQFQQAQQRLQGQLTPFRRAMQAMQEALESPGLVRGRVGGPLGAVEDDLLAITAVDLQEALADVSDSPDDRSYVRSLPGASSDLGSSLRGAAGARRLELASDVTLVDHGSSSRGSSLRRAPVDVDEADGPVNWGDIGTSPVVAVAEAAEAAAGLEVTDGIPSLPAGWPAAEPPLSPGDREGSPSPSSEEEEVKVGLTAEATEQEEAESTGPPSPLTP
eukprot:EG_transcript_197